MQVRETFWLQERKKERSPHVISSNGTISRTYHLCQRMYGNFPGTNSRKRCHGHGKYAGMGLARVKLLHGHLWTSVVSISNLYNAKKKLLKLLFKMIYDEAVTIYSIRIINFLKWSKTFGILCTYNKFLQFYLLI